MPVIELTARRLGNVEEIHLDPVEGRLALVDVRAGSGAPTIRVPGTRIRRVGTHAVMLAGRDDAVVPPLGDDDDRIESENIIGMEVLDIDGDRTGYINDVYLNRDTLAIEAYELETPWHAQPFRGPRLIMPNQVHACSQDLMIIVPRGARAPLSIMAPTRNLKVGWEERTLRVPISRQHADTEEESPGARTA